MALGLPPSPILLCKIYVLFYSVISNANDDSEIFISHIFHVAGYGSVWREAVRESGGPPQPDEGHSVSSGDGVDEQDPPRGQNSCPYPSPCTVTRTVPFNVYMII